MVPSAGIQVRETSGPAFLQVLLSLLLKSNVRFWNTPRTLKPLSNQARQTCWTTGPAVLRVKGGAMSSSHSRNTWGHGGGGAKGQGWPSIATRMGQSWPVRTSLPQTPTVSTEERPEITWAMSPQSRCSLNVTFSLPSDRLSTQESRAAIHSFTHSLIHSFIQRLHASATSGCWGHSGEQLPEDAFRVRGDRHCRGAERRPSGGTAVLRPGARDGLTGVTLLNGD